MSFGAISTSELVEVPADRDDTELLCTADHEDFADLLVRDRRHEHRRVDRLAVRLREQVLEAGHLSNPRTVELEELYERGIHGLWVVEPV